ncbi:MAG: GNAT family N-acetyltransferase [Chloroflexota bacterium]
MDFAPLTPADCNAWADLLAVSFDRTPAEMQGLLGWLLQGWPLLAWGAWDGDRLAAQYSCRLMDICVPGCDEPIKVGMSISMAVHPDYCGQGLIKQVARPVYEAIAEQGGIAGVGFSNAEGVKVDLKSKSYGYHVVGKLTSTLVWLSQRRGTPPLNLTDEWPETLHDVAANVDSFIRFTPKATQIHHRFAQHPFRRYAFGVWNEDDCTRGVVIYRPIQYGRIRGAALLAAYGDDLPELLRRWSAALQNEGMGFVHVLTSPQAALRTALPEMGRMIHLPYSRTPYYLTAKSLDASRAQALFDFNRWDCMGGDIL